MGTLSFGSWGVVGLLFVLAIIESNCGGVSTGQSGSGAAQASHVFVLVEENHSYTDVIGNPAMPYTNSLAQQFALATQYYADTHPSLPNYFMLTTGNLVASNDLFSGIVSIDNVARALSTAGKSWKIYAEGLPSVGYLGAGNVPYGKDHNPFAYFSDVVGSSSQAGNIVPMTELPRDIQNNTLPDYAMIVPDRSNDGHDCPDEAAQCTDAQKLATVDAWVQANIGPLISSSAFNNSVLIYTWDESEETDTVNGGGHVATILIGSKVKRGYQSTTLYQHQSTLRLTMELLGISDLPGAAATAPDMAEFF